jgi:predicted transcriptional regulator
MQVQDLMKRHVIKVDHQAKIIEAASKMRDENVGCVVVTIHGSPQGILTDRDIAVRCACLGHDPAECEVATHMTKPLVSVHRGTDILEAAHLMVEHGVRRIPIIDEGILLGIIALPDITQALAAPIHDLMLAVAAEHVGGVPRVGKGRSA